MSDSDDDRTASLMTPAKLAQLKARATQPAASPAAWLDQLAADAGSGHARRLVELRQQLEAQVREHDYEPLKASVQATAEELDKLDYDLLEPKGLLARVTGKGKVQGAGFVAQYDRIGHGGEDIADELRALQKKLQAQAGATDRTMLEFGVEVKALEKIIDQSTRWLQDMRAQLKTRVAEGNPDPAVQQQIREDNARCELIVERLKLLRAAISAAQQTTERCKAIVSRRAALVESIQQVLDGEWKKWQERLAPVAAEAKSTGSATSGVDRARRAQKELDSALNQAAKDCAQMQKQEQVLAGELAALHGPLQAAA